MAANSYRAMLDPYTPKAAPAASSASTPPKTPTFFTRADRCHVNAVVLDSDWEAEFAQVAEAHPRVLAYVKNQGMQFEVPYMRRHHPAPLRPGFHRPTSMTDTALDDPLHLVAEVKGQRRG